MRYLGIITIDNTEDWAVAPEDWVVAPAPGAPLKGVHAYLSRWGLAQPRRERLKLKRSAFTRVPLGVSPRPPVVAPLVFFLGTKIEG